MTRIREEEVTHSHDNVTATPLYLLDIMALYKSCYYNHNHDHEFNQLTNLLLLLSNRIYICDMPKPFH